MVRLSFNRVLPAAVLAVVLANGSAYAAPDQAMYSQFIGFTNFTDFTQSKGESNESVLLSPEIKAANEWNELVVSWNANAPAGSYLKVEASADLGERKTKFY